MIFVSANSSFGQEDSFDCGKFLTGTFRYEEEPYTKVLIHRTETKQIESIPSTGSKTTFKIVWNSACEYDLIFVKSNRPTNFKKGEIIQVKIVEVEDDSYIYEAYCRGTKSSFTIRKVSE